jgi:replicative DNA helicase
MNFDMLPDTMWIHDGYVAENAVRINPELVVTIAEDALPGDTHMEQMLLGSVLSAPNTGSLNDILVQTRHLKQHHFYGRVNGIIWEAIQHHVQKTGYADMGLVAQHLKRIPTDTGMSLLERVGGIAYLVSCMENQGHTSGVESYVNRIIEHAIMREANIRSKTLVMVTRHPQATLEDYRKVEAWTHDIQRKIADLRMGHEDIRMSADSTDLVNESLNTDFAEVSIPTGFDDLDAYIGGYMPGRLYTVGGDTGMGKSVWLLTSALRVLQGTKHRRVLYVTLEMTRAEMHERLMAMVSDVSFDTIFKKSHTDADRQKIRTNMAEAMPMLDRLLIKHMGNPTPSELMYMVENAYYQYGFDIIFIDYLGPNRLRPENNRMDVFTHASAIYNMADEMTDKFNVPVVMGAQLNRSVDKRKDKRPVKSDLYGSAAAEQHSDVIMFVYRPEKYDSNVDLPQRSELVLRKNRAGRGGNDGSVVYMHNRLDVMRFDAWSSDYEKHVDLTEDTRVDLGDL